MKKSLILLLLLAGVSAYALNGKSCSIKATPAKKTEVKKAPKHHISPLADLMSFSFLVAK